MHLLKKFKLRILDSFANVKGQRQSIEDVFSLQIVVSPHIVKKRFFVADWKILLKMIMS